MKMKEISEFYENNLLAKIIVNAIPWVGGSLDATLSHRWTKIQEKRINDLLEKVKNELTAIKESAIDKAFLESEEFYDLIYQILSHSVKSRCPETRTGYAKIIKAAILKEENVIDLESLVWQIAEFGVKDMLFLTEIKKIFDSGEAVSGNTLSMALSSSGYTAIECEILLYRYENLCLLDHPRNKMTGRALMKFDKTNLFDKLVQYLGI